MTPLSLMGHSDSDRFEVLNGIPMFITNQVEPGDVLAFTLIYEPIEEHPNRYRISAVKAVGAGEPSHA